MKHFLILALVLSLTCSVFSQPLDPNQSEPFSADQLLIPQRDAPRRDMDAAELDSFILETMDGAHIPGLSACVVRGGRVGWIGNYGWADIENEIAVTEYTNFAICSISKTVDAVALMQLWEDDEFELDDDIDDYLPFEVNHPDYPNTAITFLMLLTHTSAINDNFAILNSLSYGERDPDVALGDFLAGYLVEDGEYYTETNYLRNVEPGVAYRYINIGAALIGYLVECIAEQDFAEYCTENIFEPLGMENTSFRYEELDHEDDAHGYGYSNGDFIVGRGGTRVDYPAGCLITSVSQLSKYLIAIIQFGRYGNEDERILDSTTVERMLTVELEDFAGNGRYDLGLIFGRYNGDDDLSIWGHDGSGGGYGTTLAFHRPTGTGVLIFANRTGELISSPKWYIHRELYAYAFEFMNFGAIEGNVMEIGTNEPMEGATISTLYGRTAVTDSAGYYFLPFGDSTITVTMVGYNDQIAEELECEVDDTLALDFVLFYSGFLVSRTEILNDLEMGTSSEHALTLTNDGNGPTEWSVEPRLEGESGVDPWEPRDSHLAGQLVDDSRLQGVVYVDGRLYVSGGGNDDNMIYVLDDQGELLNSYLQLGDSRNGIADLAWDGENIWGVQGGTVYCFSTAGDSITSFETEFRTLSGITWDPDRELLWISEILSDIHGYDREGNHDEANELSRHGLQIYGLAYMPDDSSQLYVFNKFNNQQGIHKIDTDIDDVTQVTILTPENGGRPVGGFITNSYDEYGGWVFMGISDTSSGTGDRIDIWQLKANTDWMNIEPLGGTMDADGTQELTLTLDATELNLIEYSGMLVFSHNALGGSDTVRIQLDVWDVPEDNYETIPTEFAITGVYPNPFNSSTNITYSLPFRSRVALRLYDLRGRLVTDAFEGSRSSGIHTTTLTADNLPSGVYFVRLEAGSEVRTNKVILIR